jgi:hypothetical protein
MTTFALQPVTALDYAWSSAARRRSTARAQRLVVVLGVFVAVVFFVVVAFGGAPSNASSQQVGATSSGQSVTWVVQAGDTPWSIARALQPDGDVRRLASEIQRAYGDDSLHVGERITIG